MCNIITKETCTQCQKFVNIGQAITECHNCNTVFHTKCIKPSNLQFDINCVPICNSCSESCIPRYNPFISWSKIDGDKPYNDECGSDIIQISKILNSCTSYTIESLNKAIKSQVITDDNTAQSLQMSSFFMNIDGNFTNFNHFQTILKGIHHDFLAIGLAETNTSPDTSALYSLSNYTSFYQQTRSDKKSGTGVALYIHESLNATQVSELSHCNTNIESLVVKITTNDKPLYIGVIYRPNDGNALEFCEQFQHMLEQLPKERTFIM